MEKTKPLHHIRYGSVEASIWENLTQGGGAFYNVTFEKHYKDGNEWKSSQSFGMGDLLELSKVADHAHTWIARLQERARENTRAEQGCGSFGTVAQRQAMTSFRSAIAGDLW